MSKQKKNCQIPTPAKYVEQMLDYVGYKNNLWGYKVLENSCGEGNILVEIVRRYIADAKLEGHTLEEIRNGLEEDVVAYEIDSHKADVCIARLNELVSKEGLPGVKWNIKNADFLKSEESDADFIIGNPPYITYHDLTEDERETLKNTFMVCQKGRFDYCYAFIEASVRALAHDGKMIYWVPFSIFRNRFADHLRKYLRNYITKVIDYRSEDVFSEVTCSTALILCEKGNIPDEIEYEDVCGRNSFSLTRSALGENGEKWFFYHAGGGKKRFGDYFVVQNSIATLCNKAFLFTAENEDENFYFVEGMPVEKKVTLPAISTKSKNASQKGKGEMRIIFPYKLVEGKIVHYTENEFATEYPKACGYLHQFDDALQKREADKMARWFEYGRSQALSEIFEEKLIIPMVITSSTRTSIAEKKAVPYAGYFIRVSQNGNLTLSDAQKVLESVRFYNYVKEVGTPTTISSYRISVHDISEYMF